MASVYIVGCRFVESVGHSTTRQREVRIQARRQKHFLCSRFSCKYHCFPFPNETIQRLYPDLVETWTAVPWQWAMVLELSLGTFMSPTAVFMPPTTMKVFPVLWNSLTHPSSTQTSNLIAMCRDAFDLIEAAVNSERTRARLEWKPQYPRAAEARNPFSGEVNMSGGSGSLEGEGWLFRHTSDSHCEQQESNHVLEFTKR